MRIDTWLRYILLGGTFFLIGVTSYLMVRTVARSAPDVSFEQPAPVASNTKQEASKKQKLPSRSRVVTILKNNDFGLPPIQNKAEDDQNKDTSCSVEEYIEELLHYHRDQGVHVQFRNGKKKYLLLDQYYEIPSEDSNVDATSGQVNIAFTGAKDGGIEFTIRRKSGDSETSSCRGQLPFDRSSPESRSSAR